MRAILLIALLGSSSAALSQQSNAPPTASGQIVVTGERISDLRAALRQCLARNCPPDEDINATLGLAEALFVDGEYAEAREEVSASIGRNGDEARRFPEPVSDLYRVHARLSRNLGHDNSALRSTYGILNALEEGIPQQDHRHFTARFEIAEVQLRMGRLRSAKETLRDLAADARRAGREDVAVRAELRSLWFEWLADPQSDARAQLQRLARLPDTDRRYESVGARLILARILRHERNDVEADRLLAGIGSDNSGARRLLSQPEYRLTQQERGPVGDHEIDEINSIAVALGSPLSRVTENYERKWIDVGFWITPEGGVTDLDVLREGGNAGWAEPLLDSIRGRRYTAATEPTYKVERYTMTAGFEAATGTRIARRSPRARVEYLDLTNAEDAPVPQGNPIADN